MLLRGYLYQCSCSPVVVLWYSQRSLNPVGFLEAARATVWLGFPALRRQLTSCLMLLNVSAENEAVLGVDFYINDVHVLHTCVGFCAFVYSF